MTIATVQTTYPESGVVQAQWPIVNGDTEGIAVQLARWVTKSIQIAGEFGSAAIIELHGSNDGTNWVMLTDTNGSNLTFSADDIADISENTRYIKPVVDTDDALLDVVATIIGV